jgi:hypothetical protein
MMKDSVKNESVHINAIDIKDVRVIIDSGATNHMFPVREMFYILREHGNSRKRVVFGGGTTAQIVGEGDTCLVKDALYIPKLTTGVISVSRLDIAGYKTVAYDGIIEVINVDTDEQVMVGDMTMDGLYELTDIYKRMLCDPDCRNYPKDVNEDILDEDGEWIYKEDTDDSSSSESSTPRTHSNRQLQPYAVSALCCSCSCAAWDILPTTPLCAKAIFFSNASRWAWCCATSSAVYASLDFSAYAAPPPSAALRGT